MLIIGMVLVTLQLTLLRFLEVVSIKPDLIFILVGISSFYLPLRQSIFTNWLLGLLKDFTSNSAPGSVAFLYMISGLIIAFLREIFFKEDLLVRVLIMFFASYLCQFCYGLGLLIFEGRLSFSFILIKSFFIAFYTTLIALAVFYVIDYIESLIMRKRLAEELK